MAARLMGVEAREGGNELAVDVIVAVPGEGARYMAVEEGPEGLRIVTDLARDRQGRDRRIPLDYPPRGLAAHVLEAGDRVRVAVRAEGASSSAAHDAAAVLLREVERYLAQFGQPD
jgi:hypothetical protein